MCRCEYGNKTSLALKTSILLQASLVFLLLLSFQWVSVGAVARAPFGDWHRLISTPHGASGIRFLEGQQLLLSSSSLHLEAVSLICSFLPLNEKQICGVLCEH